MISHDPTCPACICNAFPPPEPGDAYIAGVVEQERGDVLQWLCQRHKLMRKAFALVDRMVLEEEAKQEKKAKENLS
jgi:hypothetical protein